MKTYVHQRLELSKVIEGVTIAGLTALRVRTECNCKFPQNRRDGVIVIDESDVIISKVIRCNSCANRKGGML